MRRTTCIDLVVPFVVVGVVGYLLLRTGYGSLPPLQPLVGVPILALAVVEFVAGRRVRAAVRHDPDAKPMAAITIARCVALGKASSLVGAGVAGIAVALVLRLLPDVGSVDAATHDTLVGVSVLVASLVLVAAGLWLERGGVDPGNTTRREANRT